MVVRVWFRVRARLVPSGRDISFRGASSMRRDDAIQVTSCLSDGIRFGWRRGRRAAGFKRHVRHAGMVSASIRKNGNSDGGGNSAQVGQEKALAAVTEIVIAIRENRLDGACVRMGMQRRSTLVSARLIQSESRVFSQFMGQMLGAGIELGKGAARARRVEQYGQQAEADGHRSRDAAQAAQGLQYALCRGVRESLIADGPAPTEAK